MKDATRVYFRQLGKRICELRKRQELSQAEVARALQLSQQSVWAFELGDRRLSLNLVAPLTRILRVSVEQLLDVRSLPAVPKVRVSPRMIRHIANVQKLGEVDRRAIIRVAEAMLRRDS